MSSWMGIALAQAEQGAAAAKQPSLFESMVPILFIFAIMYFILIRPQAKKAKEHSNLLKNLKAGDEVVTSGGIIGRIKSVADDFVTVDVGTAQLKVLKEHISRLTKPQGDKAQKAEDAAAKTANKAVTGKS